MNDTNYGLIFKDEEDDIWLGEYKNDTVRKFSMLSDFEDVYGDLALEKFAFVEVKMEANEQIWINDVSSFEIGKREDYETEEVKTVAVTTMLTEMQFPSEDSDNMFRSFLLNAGKSN